MTRPPSAAASPQGAADEPRVVMYKVAYEEGKRAVDDQLAELDSIRGKSGQFLAFVGSATAFLVGAGLRNPAERDVVFYTLASAASALSLISIVLAALILTSLRMRVVKGSRGTHWDFRLSPKVLVEDWVDADVPTISQTRFFKQLALRYDDMYETNLPNLKWMRRRYVAFLICCSVQLSVWTALVWAYA